MGFTFGQNPEQVDQIIKSGPVAVKFSEKSDDFDGEFSIAYTGNNRLKGAKETTFVFFQNKLRSILIEFRETEEDADRTYAALENKLIQKYGQNEAKNISGIYMRNIRSLTICLFTKDSFWYKKVTLGCCDNLITEEKDRKLLRKKSSEIGDL